MYRVELPCVVMCDLKSPVMFLCWPPDSLQAAKTGISGSMSSKVPSINIAELAPPSASDD